MAKRLTDAAVERLRPKPESGSAARPYIVYDALATGLGLKVTPAGKKLWIVQLRYPGHAVQTRRTLGRYPGISLESARDRAQQWYDWCDAGIDPADAEREAQEKANAERRAEALKKSNTFAAVAQRYIREHLSKTRRAKAGENEINAELVKYWAARPIGSISPADVRERIGTIKARAPFQARNVFGQARTLFKWAVHQDLLPVSPVASLEQRWVLAGAKLLPRQRVLNEQEIAAFWRATERLGYPYRPLYRLLCLTAVRVSELAKARWSELHPEIRRLIREAQAKGEAVDWAAVDNNVKVWTVPRERFKSDAEHVVPLSDDALVILETIPRFAGGEDFLFTTTDGERPINGLSKSKERLDRRMLSALRATARKRGDDPAPVKLPPWVAHDLRRVVRTNLAALNVEDHVSEMVLGHGRRGLQRVYDQHKYLDQIRVALARWAAKLRAIVGPAPISPPTTANVVTLAAKRRARG